VCVNASIVQGVLCLNTLLRVSFTAVSELSD